MIGSRGPENVLVVDRTCVPVYEICDAVIYSTTPEDIMQRYQVSSEEVFECIEVFADLAGPSENDFIELVKLDPEETEEGTDIEIDIETAAVSDWVFLTLVGIGYTDRPEVSEFRYLFAYGLQSVLIDCIKDIKIDCKDYELSDIHLICYTAFTNAYGDLTKEEATNLLEILDGVKDD